MDSKAAVYMQPVHSTVRLRCDADGRPRPTITWYKDGQEAMSRPFGKVRTETRRPQDQTQYLAAVRTV